MYQVARTILLGSAFLVALPLVGAACGGGHDLTVYSGRSRALIEPVIERFEDATGLDVEVRYGDTPELAATILEEGSNSRADVYIAQDAGSLGALVDEGKLAELPADILEKVAPAFRSPRGDWVGISGRARVVVYNTEKLAEADLPASILDFVQPAWKGRIAWAPTNGSFQSFVTALRVVEGDEVARAWLEGIQKNSPRVYDSNVAIVQAVANGEIEVGFVNHYYLYRFLAEQGEGFKARNHFFTNGDVGGLINVAGASILKSSKHTNRAEELIRFLLSDESQQYFSTETFEYPLVSSVQPSVNIPSLGSIQPPEIDLSDLDDARGTIAMLQATGVLP